MARRSRTTLGRLRRRQNDRGYYDRNKDAFPSKIRQFQHRNKAAVRQQRRARRQENLEAFNAERIDHKLSSSIRLLVSLSFLSSLVHLLRPIFLIPSPLKVPIGTHHTFLPIRYLCGNFYIIPSFLDIAFGPGRPLRRMGPCLYASKSTGTVLERKRAV